MLHETWVATGLHCTFMETVDPLPISRENSTLKQKLKSVCIRCLLVSLELLHLLLQIRSNWSKSKFTASTSYLLRRSGSSWFTQLY